MCRALCVLAAVALCVGLAHSWDFVISKGDLLEFYTNSNKANILHFKDQNLAALAYDEVQNMILYVDKQSHGDAVCGYKISSMEYECFTERNGRAIQGLAFDPATELCFFTDTNEKSINWFSLKSGTTNIVTVNTLIKMDNGIPTDIAVDSCRGYIYWINTGLTTPTIERARLNGADREVVIYPASLSINSNYKVEPYSIAIDQQTRKIFWMEPETSKRFNISSTDLNGKNKMQEYSYDLGDNVNFPKRPNTLSVSKTFMYVVDECANGHAFKLPKKNTVIEAQTYKSFLDLNNVVSVGIAANYKLSDQIQGIQECNKLTGLVRNLQCGVSVCDNYCFQGKCSVNDEGLPKCRCNAGYSGKRCEVYACHNYCQNNGVCSLSEEEKPYCQCDANHEGSRCEAAVKTW